MDQRARRLPVLIAIGGPSGVGKTTLVRELQKRFPDMIKVFPAFTTRPAREGEREGEDYYFRTEEDMQKARQDSRYGGFIEARGNWYWMDMRYVRQTMEQDRSRLYLFVLTQRREFEEYKRFFPQLKWVWISAEEREIAKRLQESGRDAASSFQHNQKLREEGFEDLVDFHVENSAGNIEQALEQLLLLWRRLSSITKPGA